jgi:hypothetical protein
MQIIQKLNGFKIKSESKQGIVEEIFFSYTPSMSIAYYCTKKEPFRNGIRINNEDWFDSTTDIKQQYDDLVITFEGWLKSHYGKKPQIF